MKLESCRNIHGDEIETTITMLGNGSEGFRVYTCNNPTVNKIGKFLDDGNSPWSIEKIARHQDGTISGYFFKCSVKNCLSLKARKREKEVTEEEREASRERMRKLRAEGKL